jgi:hypothetical protein
MTEGVVAPRRNMYVVGVQLHEAEFWADLKATSNLQARL